MIHRYNLVIECEAEDVDNIIENIGVFPLKIIGLKKIQNRRSDAQNRAIHLYFTHLAQAFYDAGLDVRTVLSKSVEHSWTSILVKELIWRKIQISMFDKKSTTKLNSDEVTQIYETINKFIGQEFEIYVPFPCIDELINKQR